MSQQVKNSTHITQTISWGRGEAAVFGSLCLLALNAVLRAGRTVFAIAGSETTNVSCNNVNKIVLEGRGGSQANRMVQHGLGEGLHGVCGCFGGLGALLLARHSTRARARGNQQIVSKYSSNRSHDARGLPARPGRRCTRYTCHGVHKHVRHRCEWVRKR